MKVVKASPRSKGAVVDLQDGPTAPIVEAWTSADVETISKWPNAVVPPEYELRDKKDGSGKVLVEKRGGGGGYSQSKEAFDRSAESRAAWQLVEEDRRDRRTAVMQAVQGIAASGRGLNAAAWRSHGAELATEMYRWLRDPDGAAMRETPAPSVGSGEGAPHSPSSEPPTAKPPKAYPVDPAMCDHKKTSGDWVKWVLGAAALGAPTGQRLDVCPKCGTPKIAAVEGTTKDLGSA